MALLRLPTGLPTGLLFLTSLIGFGALYVVSSQNGMTAAILDNIRSPSPVVPGTDFPLRTRWTRVLPLVDLDLSLMVSVFAAVLDERNLSLFLQGNHFFGQWMCAWVLVVLEAHRTTRRHVSKAYALWGLAMEFVAVGVALPAWCAMDLSNVLSMPRDVLAADTLAVPPLDLDLLPWSLLLGVGLPTLAMVATNNASAPPSDAAQVWVIVRLFHPALVLVVHSLLTALSRPPAVANRQSRAAKMGRMYGTAFWIAAVPHILLVSAVSWAYIFPHTLPRYVVKALRVESLWPVASIIPSLTAKVDSIREGVSLFMAANEISASVAMVIWAWCHVRLALSLRPCKSSRYGVLATGAHLLAFGPGATAVSLIRERDELLQADSELDKDK